jgi:MFS family permease
MSTPPRTAIRRLASARVVSVTGSEAAWIALMVAIYAETHSTVWMSAALFVGVAASGIFAPILGALGDRTDRRRLMIASELAAAVVAIAMALTTGNPAALVALAFISEAAQSPYFSASTAAVPNLVEAGEVAWANSTIAIGRNVGSLAGPARACGQDSGSSSPSRCCGW